MLKIPLALIVLICFRRACCAISSTQGREFTFAYFPTSGQNVGSGLVNDVSISSPTNTDCTLSYNDGSRKTIQIHIPAGGTSRQHLPDTTEMKAGNKIGNKGVYLNCTNSVWAYAYNQFQTAHDSSDSYTLLPHQLLSTSYLVPSIDNNPIMGIVATAPRTVVNIHLKSTCTLDYNGRSYNSGQVLTVTLYVNDVLQLVHAPFSCRTTYDCDFRGTLIESSYPTAVFSGSVFYFARDRVGSHLLFQVPPLNAYSTNIIVPHVSRPASDMNIRVLASQDNTIVSVASHQGSSSASQTTLKDRGDVADYNFTANVDLLIQSDKPVLVVQNAFLSGDHGGISIFVPGITHYENTFLIQSFTHRNVDSEEVPELTIVSQTTEVDGIYINGISAAKMHWAQVDTTSYSVGTMTITKDKKYKVESRSPVLLRLHQWAQRSSYGFIGGYKLDINQPIDKAVSLQCLQNNWLVAVDLKKLSLGSVDIPNIYLGSLNCTGFLQGDHLIFNVSYDQCNTTEKVVDDKITYKNSVWYAPVTSDQVILDVQWVDDLTCSHSLFGTDSVHIYPKHNTTNYVSSSGEVHGGNVHISLYKDSSFQTPFVDSKFEVQLGQPVYVQVEAPGSQNLIMIIKSCHAHLTDDPGSSVSHPLISSGCPADHRVNILASRNQVTRFKFDMFTLPHEIDGIYVTCNVKFCSMKDFSSQCQLGCHTDQHPGIVGK